MSEEYPLSGRVVDERYRILEPLGEGGMGVVFRAEHLSLRRPVALKVLQQDFAASEDLKARFEREAQALAALSHPNIVTVTDYGVFDTTPYIVMELLEGQTLQQRLERGPLPPAEALDVARQMLRALAHAHRQGIVHRDLKPGNIFLVPMPDSSAHVKILDFGLVRFIGDAGKAELTRDGLLVGTPSYMAPEQASGVGVDARTDVYAAGIVIFEMLAGRKPFIGDPAEVIRQHLLEQPPALTDIHPGLENTGPIERVLQRALSKRMEGRQADASELLTTLDATPAPTVSELGAPTLAHDVLATMPTLHAEKGVQAPVRAPDLSDSVPTVVTAPGGVRSAPELSAPTTPMARKPTKPPGGVKNLWIGVGGGILAAGLLIALVSGGDEATTEAPTEAPAGTQAEGAPPEPTPSEPLARNGVPPEAGAPAAARPAARDPFSEPVPRALSRVARAVASGREVSARFDKSLIRYARDHRGDARPQILLARAYLSRGWRSDAIERYGLAHREDPSARGNPAMLEDLVSLSGDAAVSGRAQRLVEEIYGAEALAAAEAAAAEARGADRARLERLVAKLRALP